MEDSSQPRLIEEFKEIHADGKTIVDLIELLDGVISEGFTEVELCSGEYHAKMNAVKQRRETPEEVEMRLKRESWYEEREKAEYERLRAKYGNVD